MLIDEKNIASRDYTKTLINALKAKMLTKETIADEDDALELLAEMEIIIPITDSDDSVLTDENGNIFVI